MFLKMNLWIINKNSLTVKNKICKSFSSLMNFIILNMLFQIKNNKIQFTIDSMWSLLSPSTST